MNPELPALAEKDIVNPINPLLPIDKKVEKLIELSQENEEPVKEFISKIDQKLETTSEFNHKLPDRIKEKAERPSIRQKKGLV